MCHLIHHTSVDSSQRCFPSSGDGHSGRSQGYQHYVSELWDVGIFVQLIVVHRQSKVTVASALAGRSQLWTDAVYNNG